jgi:hypothetical protein
MFLAYTPRLADDVRRADKNHPEKRNILEGRVYIPG